MHMRPTYQVQDLLGACQVADIRCRSLVGIKSTDQIGDTIREVAAAFRLFEIPLKASREVKTEAILTIEGYYCGLMKLARDSKSIELCLDLQDFVEGA